jgi:hypothetical protein
MWIVCMDLEIMSSDQGDGTLSIPYLDHFGPWPLSRDAGIKLKREYFLHVIEVHTASKISPNYQRHLQTDIRAKFSIHPIGLWAQVAHTGFSGLVRFFKKMWGRTIQLRLIRQ